MVEELHFGMNKSLVDTGNTELFLFVIFLLFSLAFYV